MYRPQIQNIHSQPLNYHGRPPPEATLFEDSPKTRPPPYQHDTGYHPRNQDRLNMLRQSEEFGVVQHSQESAKEMGGHDSDDNPEGENDIEYIIMNLYSKMKNLENKYIDLANFYKQELVRSSSAKKNEGHERGANYGQQQVRSSAISPSHSFERSPDDDLDQSPGRRDMPQEREIIQDLIEEKKKLEEDMKQMITMRTSSYYQAASQQQSPQKKQQDYQSSVWYDPKSRQSHQTSELNPQVQGKLGQLQHTQGMRQESEQQMHEQFRDIQMANAKFLQDMEKEITSFKRKSDYFQMNIQKLKGSLKFKENNIRDDQQQMKALLRDIYKNLQTLESRDYLLLSGDKNQNMLSPFEKRLANYQKSAEMRKESNNPLNRSGSRGRHGVPSATNTGSNFYRGDYNSNQALTAGVSGTDTDQDSQVLKTKFKHFQRLFEDYNIKTNIVLQEENEINKIVEDTFQDQSRFLKANEHLVGQLNSFLKQIGQSGSKMRNQQMQQQQNMLPVSPTYNQKYDSSQGNYSQMQKFNQQEQKLVELQRHNDQLFSQLRQANEKYLDERVETNKLTGEIKQLQKNLEITKSQYRKQLQSAEPSIKQQIRKHSQQRNDQSAQPGVKQSSYSSATSSKENEDLKKRVQELEKECLTLTYYNQDIQRVGSASSDPYIRQIQQENQEGKNNFSQICLLVQEFLMSMRRLQRAVNSKDKDIALHKSDFERVKKGLEKFIAETKEMKENKVGPGYQTFIQGRPNSSMLGFGNQTSNSNHHSMIISQERRDSRFGQDGAVGGLRNKSQAPLGSALNRSNRSNQPPVYPTTQRPEVGYANEQFPPQSTFIKKGVIKPKTNNFIQSPSPQLEAQETSYQASDQQSPSQEQKFNRLVDEIKQIEDQSERQRHQIEDLKQVNEMLLAEKNAAEIKCNAKAINIQKLNQQLKQSYDKVKQQEKLIDEYKAGLTHLEQAQNLSKLGVSKIKTELMIRERELFNGVIRESPSLSTMKKQESSPSLTQQTINNLRQQLSQQIDLKEKEFESVLVDIQQKLQAKEQDLARVKKLFVEKLRELESSFNEISQEMVDSEQVQQETSKRYQQQLTKQQYQNQQRSELEKSLENVIGRADDDLRDEDIDKLVNANEDLLDQNSQLRQKIKQLEQEGVNSEEHKALAEELALLKEDNEELEQQVKQLREDEYNVQKQLDQLKAEHKSLQKQFADINKQKELLQQDYQKQLNELEDQLQGSANTLLQEQEQRVFHQSQANSKEKQLKVIRNDKQALQNENDRLAKSEQNLQQQLDQMRQEQEYMAQLRKDKNTDSFSEQQPDGEDSMFLDEQENQKMELNPSEAAKSYYRMLKATKKEFQIQTKTYDKLQDKYEELKSELREFRQESRADAENNINREARLFDLESSNQRLEQELERAKGQYVIEEDAIRQKIEVQFRERLAFKETEVASMTDKLARVSQTNSEMTTKILRIEGNVQELSADNEAMRHKISALEMELEMTKSNGERDTETLMEQQQQREAMQKVIAESEKAKEQSKADAQIRQVEAQRLGLEQKLADKKQKLKAAQQEQEKQKLSGKLMDTFKQSLENKLQEMQRELEAERQQRQEREQAIEEQAKLQEQEREQLVSQQEVEKSQLIKEYQAKIQQQELKSQEQDQVEQQLIQKHQQETMRLEKRLKDEREQQESRLLESEKEKIGRIRKEMLAEKERQLQEKEAVERQQASQSLEQLRLRLEQEKREEIEKRESENRLVVQTQDEVRRNLESKLQKAVNQMESEQQQAELRLLKNEEAKAKQVSLLQAQITEQEQSTTKQLKQQKLVQVLQKHAREALLVQLQNEQAQKEEKERAEQQRQEQLETQYQQELESLKELNRQEMGLIEEKLKREAADLRKEKRQLKLVQVLQSKARESLLSQIEEERVRLQQSQLQEQNKGEQEKSQIIEQNKGKILVLEQKLVQQSLQAGNQIRELKLAQCLLLRARECVLRDHQHFQEARALQQIEDQHRIQKLSDEHEAVLLKMNQVKVSHIQLLEQKLEHDQEVAKKDKKTLLLVKVLQQKARQILQDELEQANQSAIQEQQKIKERTKLMEAEHQKSLQELQSKREQQQAKLEALNQSSIEQQKAMKQMRLVYSLQIQARNTLLKQLEEEKVLKCKYLKAQQASEQETARLLQQIEQMEVDQQLELEQFSQEYQSEIDHLNEELHKVRKEQEDLVNSLSQQQDQQTQDLLTQKDNEAKHLVTELTHKHAQEVLEREKQGKIMQAMQDKIRQDLEEKVTQKVQEREEIVAQMEQDLQMLNQDQEEQLEALKLQSQEELEELRIRFEQENLEKQRELLEVEEQLEQTKEHQKQMIQKFSESKQEEIQMLRDQISELQQQNILLQNQLDDCSEQYDLVIQQERGQFEAKIASIQESQKAEVKQLQARQISEINEYRKLQETAAEQLSHANQQVMDQLRAKLEQESKEAIAQKNSEKTMFEKMQQKVREELQVQLEQAQSSKQESLQKLADCQLEISKRELQQQSERISQQEQYDSLSQNLAEAKKVQAELNQTNQKLTAQLQAVKKQQAESENSQLQELRTKLESITAQNEKLGSEVKAKDKEVADGREKLKQSKLDTENLEKDMDQFGKEMEEERAQNEANREKMNGQLEDLGQQLRTKSEENSSLVAQQKQDKLQIGELEAQLAQLKTTYQEEVQGLSDQNKELRETISRAASGNDRINESIDQIEAKLGEFDVELGKVKKLERQLEQQKQLNDSLMQIAAQNSNKSNNYKQVISQIGSGEALQYIKRVKYQDKAWILLTQQENYYWIDQDSIPVQKLQGLQFDEVEDLGVKLQDQLDVLQSEKDRILGLINEQRSQKQHSSVANDFNTRQELGELQLAHNALQQNNLQLKQRINELNEMIFGLADTDKEHENVKKIVELHKKSEELSRKLRLQIEETKKFEGEAEERQLEIEALRKQFTEQDYSFAKGGRSFNQGSKPENFMLEASSIGRDPDEESFNHINVEVAAEPVQAKIKRLELEVEEYQRLQKELEDSNQTLQDELQEVKAAVNTGQGSGGNDAEMQDHLKHTRSILIKFLEKVPITSKENEDLLPIVYSMMLFTKEEMNSLMNIRQATAALLTKDLTKKGVFGMFGNKKDKK